MSEKSRIRRVGEWFEERTGVAAAFGPMMTHPVPSGAGWLYVFGSTTLFAFLVQIVTGIALAALYVPSADQAYASLEYITNRALLGRWLRSIHFYGGSAMVLFAGVHMIRVYLTGAFKYPRQVNWLSGVVLLICTVGLAFSGQVLRWNQDAIWGLVVGAEQAGRFPWIGKLLASFVFAGRTLNADTLSRFFDLHVFILPVLLVAVLGLHLHLVLRNGISEPPRAGRPVDPKTYRSWYEKLLEREGVPFFPNAAWRDVVFATVMIVGIALIALWVGPPSLGEPPDPTNVDAVPRPDWWLIWYFSMLALIPPGSEAYVMILAPLLGFGLLFVTPFLGPRGERHPARRPWAVGLVIVFVTAIGSLTRIGYQAPWSPRFHAAPLPEAQFTNLSAAAQRGVRLFNTRGCLYCHTIDGHGGIRGPNLSHVGLRLTKDRMTLILMNGAPNMPAFAAILATEQVSDLTTFLETRK